MVKEINLEGLSCANCAVKIEEKVQKLEGVNSASVDFVLKKLTLDAKGDETGKIMDEVKRIVRKIEPGVRIDTVDERKQYNDEVKILAGVLIFASGLLFSNISNLTSIILYLLSYLILGSGVLLRAFKGIIGGDIFSEYFLMSIATLGALIIGEYPEGVAVMLFYLIGEYFQEKAVDNSRKSITGLMNIRPDYANLIIMDKEIRVAPEEVSVGDKILIKSGEKIPLDGIVLEGKSTVDTSAITGESLPKSLKEGDTALSGFINRDGLLTIKVTKNFGESTVSKILEMVYNSSSRKAPTEKFITRFARYYTPIVVFSALTLALLPPILGFGGFLDWTYRALVFLVVSCPCALVISVPLSFFAGIGSASRQGVLIKGGNFLDALNNVETVVFDKTGTLTKGIFEVSKINIQDHMTKDELLMFAAYAESYSSHPIANSIIKAYNFKIDKSKIKDFREVAGKGIKATVFGKEVILGSSKLLELENIDYKKYKKTGTVIYIAIDKKYAGSIVISDKIKKDAKETVRELKDRGIKTAMLTGDLKSVGDSVGTALSIDQVFAELLPLDKVNIIENMDRKKSKKGKIVFVGDGVNDAPVLARSDIGVAMGGLGSDAALEAADIVIISDEPSKIISAMDVSRKTRKKVTQNIIFAMSVKLIFLILGAFGFASMWEAVFADVGVTLLAILNSMSILKMGGKGLEKGK